MGEFLPIYGIFMPLALTHMPMPSKLESRIPMPDVDIQKSSTVLSSLFIQAVREGQSLWFRVASNSMFPLFQINDTVYIVPSTAQEIWPGDIAAFETTKGLVIHRILQRTQTGQTIRLLQMSDVDLCATLVKEERVVGKVIAVRKARIQIDLEHRIAKWYGKIVAAVRHRLYLDNNSRFSGLLWRGCSRLSRRFGYWCIQRCCAAPITGK